MAAYVLVHLGMEFFQTPPNSPVAADRYHRQGCTRANLIEYSLQASRSLEVSRYSCCLLYDGVEDSSAFANVVHHAKGRPFSANIEDR